MMLVVIEHSGHEAESLGALRACQDLLQDIISDFDEHVNREKETDVENME